MEFILSVLLALRDELEGIWMKLSFIYCFPVIDVVGLFRLSKRQNSSLFGSPS